MKQKWKFIRRIGCKLVLLMGLPFYLDISGIHSVCQHAHGAAVSLTDGQILTISSNTADAFTLASGTAMLYGNSLYSATGNITISSGAELKIDNLTLPGGGKSNSGTLHIIKYSDATLGKIRVQDGGIDNSHGNVLIDAGSTLQLANGSIISGTITNNGTLEMGVSTISGTSALPGTNVRNNGDIKINSGTYLIGDNTTITGGTITNMGNLVVKVGGMTLNETSLRNSGTIRISQNDFSTPTLKTIGASITGGSLIIEPNGFSMRGGALEVAASSIPTTLTGISVTNYGAITIDSGATLQTEGAAISGGTLGGTLTNNGTLAVANGTTTLSGSSVTNNGTVLVATGGGLTVASGTVENRNQMTVDGGTLALTGGRLTNDAGSTITVSSGDLTVAGTLNNAGSMVVTGGTVSGAGLTNTGTMLVNGGTLAAATTVASGGKLNISSGTVAGATTIGNSGAMDVTGGVVTGNTTVTGSGELNVSSGTVAGATTVENSGNMRVTGGIVSGTTDIYSGGTMTVSGGTISGLITNNGVLNVNGGTFILASGNTVGRSMAISNLGGNATFVINTDVANHRGDTVSIATASAPATLHVGINYDPSLTSGISYSGSVAGYSPITIASGASNVTLVGVANENGAYSILPTFSGTSLANLYIGPSSNTKAAASSASGQAELMQTSVNHLRKRLGDLRNSPEQEEGIWARVYSGDVTNNKYTPVESDYKGLQVGYDKSRQTNDGRIYTGGALSYTKADNSFYRGGGDSEVSDVALYQTWLGKDGHYYDVIAKHGRLSSNYHVTDLSNNYSTANYSTGTDSLSVEYGYRKQLANGWYLEPQTELTYGHLNSVNYTTSSGLKVKQDSMARLIGRIGLGAGKKLNDVTQLYTSLSALHEFKGEQNLKADNLNYSQDLSGTWYEFILGASAKLSDHSNGYINVEKLFGGDVSSNWQVNAGCRWSF